MELAEKELGLTVVEQRIPKSDVFVSDEFFMTGTAAHVTPVLSVDGRPVGDGSIGPITARLQALYFDIVRGKSKAYADWLSPTYTKVAGSAST
jgi:branched-chain amino acid aminotransferase